jgi:hypothetical protein
MNPCLSQGCDEHVFESPLGHKIKNLNWRCSRPVPACDQNLLISVQGLNFLSDTSLNP